MRLSRRVLDTPPYLFHLIDQKRKAAQEKGIDVVSLAIGDPDQPTPQFVLDLMAEEIRDPRNHVYPGYKVNRISVNPWRAGSVRASEWNSIRAPRSWPP